LLLALSGSRHSYHDATAKGRERRKAMIRERWILTLIISLVLVGCATTKGDWQKAVELNTVEAYKEFLLKHPQNEFAGIARKNIERLEWESVKRNDNIESYQQFISIYPYSEFTNFAKNRVEELNWRKSVDMNSIDGYKNFLQNHPQSKYSTQAYEKIEEIAWEMAHSKDTAQDYEEFLSVYPTGKYATKAKDELDTQRWVDANNQNTLESYEFYLKHQPNGKFVKKAKYLIQIKKIMFKCKPVSLNLSNEIEQEIVKYVGIKTGQSFIVDAKYFSLRIIGLSEEGNPVDCTIYVSTGKKGEICTVSSVIMQGKPGEEFMYCRDGKCYPTKKVVSHQKEIEEGSTMASMSNKFLSLRNCGFRMGEWG